MIENQMSIKFDKPHIGHPRAAKCHADNGLRAFRSIPVSMFLCVKECALCVKGTILCVKDTILCVKDTIPCVKSFILRIKEPASGISDIIIGNK